MGRTRYVWFGTEHDFGVFTFLFEETPHGVVQAHCYPYGEGGSTFIVETAEETWRAADLEPVSYLAVGESDPQAKAFAEKVFGHHLTGHELIGNNSQWISFPEVTTDRWWWDRYVLLGDAAHTAHFSIGSGTKLAMEDAIALVEALGEYPDQVAALEAYETERKPVVESTQRAARTSQAWFASVARYWELPRPQFDFQLLTRSQRITLGNLRLRDPETTRAIVSDWQSRQEATDPHPDTPPMFHPFRLRAVTIPNRVPFRAGGPVLAAMTRRQAGPGTVLGGHPADPRCRLRPAGAAHGPRLPVVGVSQPWLVPIWSIHTGR